MAAAAPGPSAGQSVLCVYSQGVSNGDGTGLMLSLDPVLTKVNEVASLTMAQADSKEELSEIIREKTSDISVLVVVAHGARDHFEFGENGESVVTKEDVPEVFEGLNPHAQVFLISCRTAGGAFDSIAYRVAEVTGNTVFAPYKDAYGFHVHLNPRFDFEGEPLFYLRAPNYDRLARLDDPSKINHPFYLAKFERGDAEKGGKACRYKPFEGLTRADAPRIARALSEKEICALLKHLIWNDKALEAFHLAKNLQSLGSYVDLHNPFVEQGLNTMASELINDRDPMAALALM